MVEGPRSAFLDPMPGGTPLARVMQEWVDAFRLDKACVAKLQALLTQADKTCAADLLQITVPEWMTMLGDCGMEQDALSQIKISMGTVQNPFEFPGEPVDDDMQEKNIKENTKGGVKKEVAESLDCRRWWWWWWCRVV